jgi:HK97 family phage portal protein
MSFKSKIGQMFNYTSGLKNPANWLVQYFGGTKSSAGINVTLQSALGVPEIWNAVSKISGHISSLPLELHEYSQNGDNKVVQNDRGAKVWASPNQIQTNQVVVEKVMIDALLLGNGRLFIERNSMGQATGLIPLQAENTQTVMVEGQRWHCVSINSGTEQGQLTNTNEQGTLYKIPDEDVFYVMGLTTNGYWGENTLSIFRDTIGLSIAGGESAGTIFQNSGRPGLLLEAPTGAFGTNDDAQAFLEAFNAAHTGLDNQGKTGLLRNGMKAVPMSYPTMDQSHIGMRQFQRECAALIFLLESVIGDSGGSVYKSITERQSVYLTNCLNRWISKIEQEANKKLMSARNIKSGNYEYKMDISPLFSNDRDGLALYTSSLRQQGVLSGNEVRELHGFGPVPELADDYAVMTMGNAAGSDPADPEEEKQADTEKDTAETPTPEPLKEDE